MNKPPEVKKAQQKGNREALSAMGKKGAYVTNVRRDLIASSDAALAKKRKELFDHEMHQRTVEANEHIVPVDDTQKPAE